MLEPESSGGVRACADTWVTGSVWATDSVTFLISLISHQTKPMGDVQGDVGLTDLSFMKSWLELRLELESQVDVF